MSWLSCAQLKTQTLCVFLKHGLVTTLQTMGTCSKLFFHLRVHSLLAGLLFVYHAFMQNYIYKKKIMELNLTILLMFTHNIIAFLWSLFY